MHLVLKIIPKKWLIIIALSLLFLLGTILLGATMVLIGGMEEIKNKETLHTHKEVWGQQMFRLKC